MTKKCRIKTPKKQENNPNDKIGEVKTIPDACGPAGTVGLYVKKYIPNNGEYEWKGEKGSCHYDGGHAGNEITCKFGCAKLGHCAIIGKRGTYARTKYLADPSKCCAEQPKNGAIHGKTCDPKYTTSNPTCRDAIRKKCGLNWNIFSNPVCQRYCREPNNQHWCRSTKESKCQSQDPFKHKYCKPFCETDPQWCDRRKQSVCDSTKSITNKNSGCQEWCKDNSSFCRSAIQGICTKDTIFHDNTCISFCSEPQNKEWCTMQKHAYCNKKENIGSETCQMWCMMEDNMGQCDQGMTEYCKDKKNKDKKICSCINSKATKWNPVCIDADCAGGGYQTNSMLTTTRSGCNIVDCSQYVELNDAKAGQSINLTASFKEKCGQTTEKNEEPTDSVSGNPRSINIETEADSIDSKVGQDYMNLDKETETNKDLNENKINKTNDEKKNDDVGKPKIDDSKFESSSSLDVSQSMTTPETDNSGLIVSILLILVVGGAVLFLINNKELVTADVEDPELTDSDV